MTSHDLHTGRLLAVIEDGEPLSQRALSRRLGIALGLTNFLLRQLAARRWIRVVKDSRNRIRYVITAEGAAAREHLAKIELKDGILWYATARERIRKRLQALSSDWPVPDGTTLNGSTKPVVFYGAGELAEIAYVCLQQTDLTLVGVVDERGDGTFFGRSVRPVSALGPSGLDEVEYGRVVVTTFAEANPIRAQLMQRGCSEDRLFWL